MLEDDTEAYHMVLPTEVLLHVFKFLTAKDLTKCRQVCLRWKSVIDGLQTSTLLWQEHCRKDFNEVYRVARSKARVGLTWYDIYKSLSLWPKLAFAREIRNEFASASCVSEEIMDIQALQNGIVGVQRRASIIYYDVETLELSNREPVSGNYLKYIENDDTIIVLNLQLHLLVTRKILKGAAYQTNATFDYVKCFVLVDRYVYFANHDEEIYIVNLDNEHLNETILDQCPNVIVCLGYSNNKLHALTYDRTVYSIIGNELVLVYTIGPSSNLLHILREYNFLEHLDWRMYLEWLYMLNLSPNPGSPLADIIIIRTYGDVVFVGSSWGVLRIYYAPYSSGEFDLYSSEPIKQYNFMERIDCPVLTDHCPIVQIDVLESEDGHTVLVAMPKKVVVLEFVHNFKRTASAAMLPYWDMHRVKILRIKDSV